MFASCGARVVVGWLLVYSCLRYKCLTQTGTWGIFQCHRAKREGNQGDDKKKEKNSAEDKAENAFVSQNGKRFKGTKVYTM